MRFNKDNAGGYGKKSSRKGISNKTNLKIKTAFAELLENNLEKLQSDIDSMKSVERFNAVMQLAKYVIPSLKSVQMETTSTDEVNSDLINKLLAIPDATFENLENE